MKRILESITIPNLTVYLVLATALVSGLSLIVGPELTGWKRLLYPLQLARAGGVGEWLWLGLLLIATYSFGTGLEADMGRVRFNAYVFLGYAFVTLGGFLYAPLVPAWYLSMSMVLGTAYYGGDREILLFFVIPMKIKWFAYAFVAIASIEAVAGALAGPVWFATAPILGMGNFLIVCGSEWLLRRREQGIVLERLERIRPVQATLHRCAACGITEVTNPEAEFRYCVQCSDHEYCMEHLWNHEHR